MCTKDQYKDRVIAHKLSVKVGIHRIIDLLSNRAEFHDDDKLEEEMVEEFSKKQEKFNSVKFGSEEYEKLREELKPLLDKHYSINSHHPEFYKNGISGMTLIDLIEMLVDWKSASSAYGDGFEESLEITRERFKVDEQLFQILLNTAKYLGYTKEEK